MEQSTILMPNFRNLGVVLRALVLVHLGVLIYVFISINRWNEWINKLTEISLWVEPVLLISLAGLAVVSAQLQKMNYRNAVMTVLLWVFCVAFSISKLFQNLIPLDQSVVPWRFEFITLSVTFLLLHYYQLWIRALSPRLAEARLVALQARIRPHFFFNSLNAVLSLIRSQPKLAERLLENLSELFRVAMGTETGLSTMAREVELAQGYLEIEKVRLGDRLQVEWHIDKMPKNALIPPLILQPLLENAIYHGIEPNIEPGIIQLNIFRVREEVHINIRNPLLNSTPLRRGNGMAQENVRERLLLYYDAEANLSITTGNDYYQIHIMLPYREL
ncbi:sensor histidine kinase [Deefgea piscis]|uniref:sensor histidine kinase n=1 Tax=Deefgea piscis TaxID=2739061 RepID=UPI001C7F6B0C|nr:histidine kinase [Deefgea piscis]QZA81407.1 histidine kinase [Deefgea piscis]